MRVDDAGSPYERQAQRQRQIVCDAVRIDQGCGQNPLKAVWMRMAPHLIERQGGEADDLDRDASGAMALFERGGRNGRNRTGTAG